MSQETWIALACGTLPIIAGGVGAYVRLNQKSDRNWLQIQNLREIIDKDDKNSRDALEEVKMIWEKDVQYIKDELKEIKRKLN